MIDIAAIKTRFSGISPLLDERERRLFAASEARAAGRGGIVAVARATGIRNDFGPGTRPRRYVICYNPARAHRDAAARAETG